MVTVQVEVMVVMAMDIIVVVVIVMVGANFYVRLSYLQYVTYVSLSTCQKLYVCVDKSKVYAKWDMDIHLFC